MLKINGRDYELRYPINVLCSMCDAGIDVMNLKDLKINVKVIRELFMYGLRYSDKKLTQAQAGDLMDAFFDEGGDFNELVTEVMGCLSKSLGGKKGSEEEDGEGK